MSADRPAIDVPPHVLDYLRRQKALTLATVSTAGLPHAATLVYVNDGLAIYCCTRPDTVTARHLDQNPAVSFAIDEYADDWGKTKGIQGSGEGHVLLNPADIERAVALFQQKFPFLTDAHTANLALFRITPSEVLFIDNEQPGGEQAGQAFGAAWRRSLVYSVFRDLPRQEVDTVLSRLATMRVNAGDVIVRQGAPADKFFIIVDGEVEVIREDDGRRTQVATLTPGQFFGEIAILRDQPRAATVQARVSTTLLAMDRETFRALVAQSLGTAQDFDRLVRQRLDELAAGGGR